MKKIICVLIAVLLLCVGTVPSFAANPKISVKTESAAAMGDTITVSAVLSSNTGLGGIDFTVKFNTSEFQLVSGSVSASSLFLADTNVSDGSIRYAGISAETVKSNGTLMTFKLKVLKTGGKITLSVNDAINGNDEIITSSVSVAGATVNCSHAKAQWIVTKKPTCTEKGVETRTCTCGNVSTRDIAAKGHTYKWVVEKEATETQKGLKIGICSVCGDKKEQVIPLVVQKETTTEKVTETETTTSETTTSEETTSEIPKDEPVTEVSIEDAVKSATVKTAVITLVSVLGIESVIGLLVFLIVKNKKKK